MQYQYYQPQRPNPAKVIIWIILALAIGAMIHGCSYEHKMTKYVNAVNADVNYQVKVATQWLDAHPCITTLVHHDSTVIAHDTILSEKKVIIPRIVNKRINIDTIIDNVSLLINDSVIAVKCLDGEKTITKTVTKVVVDQTEVNRFKDTAAQRSKEISYYQGKNDSLVEQSMRNIKKIDKLWVVIILLSIGAILSHVARSYLNTFKLPKL
jgi:hypothetical protein